MKMKIIFIVLVFSSSLIIAQRKVADKFFNKYSYVKAGELYQEAFKKGDSSKYILERLGDCYYNNSDSKNAAKWLGKLVDLYPKKIEQSYLLKYVQTQQSLGNYKESDKWLEALNESDRQSFGKIEELISTDSKFVEIKNLDINSKFSDFGLFIKNNTALFASAKNEIVDTKNRIYGWNGQPYLDIYQANINDDNEFSNIQLIPAPDINTKYHESSAVITNDGGTLYFTRVNVNKRNKLNFDEEGTTHLKLYQATLEGDEWVNIMELPFNDDNFSTGHPALSPDNKKLYFISDRAGGFGQTDIYYVDILENDMFGVPINLGANVNTKGREMFPFVANDNTLYFSSDDYINIGLLDIFKTDIINDENALPENIGAPYNSRDDDFAFSINQESKTGYFSSNREGGKGSDDIYSYQVVPCTQNIKGTVQNSKSNEFLDNAIVKLIDENGKILKEIRTTTDGEFVFVDVSCTSNFTVVASKEDFKDDLEEVSTTQLKGDDVLLEMHLTPLINDCEITLNPIFFDFDKWNIRTDSKVELENIVDVMRKHLDMKLNIESHTDKRGTDRYNLKLSDKRAKSTRDYLISRGIDASRFISAIGYGESRPVNDCSMKGVKCSEEEHQKNRRSHFYIDGCK